MTRQTLDGKHPNGWIPEQKLTLDQALRAFTVGSAYAEFAEKVKGTIAPGKLADLVMLDRDLYQTNPADIDKARVLLTVMDGEVVWEAKQLRHWQANAPDCLSTVRRNRADFVQGCPAGCRARCQTAFFVAVQVWGVRPPRALPYGALAGWLLGVQVWLARAPSTAPVAGARSPKPEQAPFFHGS